DEDGHAGLDLLGEARHLGEQSDEVDRDVAGVGPTVGHGDGDARLPADAQLRPVPPPAHRERPAHPAAPVDAVPGARRAARPVRLPVAHGEVAGRAVQGGGRRAAQVGVRARLDLAGTPPGPHGHRPQLPEQHGLAHPAQPGEDEAALRPAAGDPLQHDLEGVELLVAPGELGGPLARAGRERVAHGVHASDGIGESCRSRRSRYRRRWRVADRRVYRDLAPGLDEPMERHGAAGSPRLPRARTGTRSGDGRRADPHRPVYPDLGFALDGPMDRDQARRVAASARQNSPNAANPAATVPSSHAPATVLPSARSAASSPPACAGSAYSAAAPASTPTTPSANARARWPTTPTTSIACFTPGRSEEHTSELQSREN